MVSSMLIALALAGPMDDTAERTWLLVENGRAAEARTELTEALTSVRDPLLVASYIEASTQMGLGPQAVAETQGMPVELRWEADAEPLAGLVVAGDDSGAIALVHRLQETYPEHPEVLAPLWIPTAGRKLVKLREGVFRTTPAEPATRARLLKLHQLVHQPDVTLMVAVEQDAGLDAYGPPATDVELHDHARSLAEKGLKVADLDLRAEERRLAVERAHPMFLDAGQPLQAVAIWEELGAVDAGALGFEVDGLWRGKKVEEAAERAAKGFRALGAPAPSDVVVADLSTRATWAVQLLGPMSEVDAAQERGGHAWARAVAATALAGAVRGSTLGPNGGAASLAATYPGRDKVVSALALASKAKTAEERHTHLLGAWTAVASGAARLEDVARSPDLYLSALAEVWREGAMVLSEGEGADAELALAYGTLALLAGPADRVLEARLATLHDQLDSDAVDHSFAAFHHAALARGLGAEGMESLIREHHSGLGEAMAVATSLGGAPPPPDALPEPPPRRSLAVRGGKASTPPKGGAVIGERIPDFSVETAYGTMSRNNLSGRVVVFTFFASDHAASVEQLQESGSVARQLRGRGLDVVHVGISQDADRGRFDDLHRVGQRWGQLAWAPQVAMAFGVARQPTTWVVDRNGIARYFVDHRIRGADLQSVIEGIAIE